MWNTFLTFNINAMNKLIYTLSTNLWLLLSIISVGIIVAMSLKNVIDTTIRDEQNVL